MAYIDESTGPGAVDRQRFFRERRLWLERVADDPEVTPSAFLVAFAIQRNVGPEFGYAWTGREHLASLTRLKPRQIGNLLQQLKALGYLEVRRRPNTSNTFRLLGPDGQPVACPVGQPVASPDRHPIAAPCSEEQSIAHPDRQSSAARKGKIPASRIGNGLPPKLVTESQNLNAGASAPARPDGAVGSPPWTGPADIWLAVVEARGTDWARRWLGPTTWRDLPEKAIVCDERAEPELRREITRLIGGFGARIVRAEPPSAVVA